MNSNTGTKTREERSIKFSKCLVRNASNLKGVVAENKLEVQYDDRQIKN